MSSAKTMLLSQVSPGEILKFYLPEYTPGEKRNYKSPFSEKDDHPSLNIYEKDGILMFKSHNTGHQGDVFQFVADLKGINCKSDFSSLISLMAEDLGVNIEQPEVTGKRSIKITFESKPNDLNEYFANFLVDPDTLKRFNVRQVRAHEFISATGKHCRFNYQKLQQLAICYSIGDRIKIYFPEIKGKQEKAFGFKDQTNVDIFGYDQLQGNRVDRLFISAGEKDCLVLNSLGFHSVCFQSENTIPTTEQTRKINDISYNIYIIYDSDSPGKKAAQKLSLETGWKIIQIPEKDTDVAEWLPVVGGSKLLELAGASRSLRELADSEQKPTEVYTIFHQAEDFLTKYYDFRYNTVSLDIEYSAKGREEYRVANENQLYVSMNKAGIKIEIAKLISILKSDFVPHFNPIHSYFHGLPPWDGVDHIQNLASHLQSEHQEQLSWHFRKWLVRCVRCGLEPHYYNKQAFIIVHNAQNSGKTTFCRYLCPPALGNYIAENISDDKDSRIALVKNFLINLDELSSLARHEINSLKALFSKDCINERLPYDRKNSIIPRIANFMGSTNMGEFLTDETGSVRWLCFEITGIDWSYRSKIDINLVWAQAYHLYKSGYDAELSTAEIAENEKRNSKFQQRSAEAEIIPTLLEPATPNDSQAIFMTATDVLQYLQIWTTLRFNKVMIGRAMPSLGFSRVKDSRTDRYGYWCIRLKEEPHLSIQ